MDNLVNFLIWAFTLLGLTMIVTVSAITLPIRNKIAQLNRFIGELLSCPMCFSFWAGMLLSYFYQSITGNIFFDGVLGSGIVWYLSSKFRD
jgi:hypothetical protein